MASKRETSVEPRVEEKATGWLSKYGIQYWLKSESMNSEIDNALKDALYFHIFSMLFFDFTLIRYIFSICNLFIDRC